MLWVIDKWLNMCKQLITCCCWDFIFWPNWWWLCFFNFIYCLDWQNCSENCSSIHITVSILWCSAFLFFAIICFFSNSDSQNSATRSFLHPYSLPCHKSKTILWVFTDCFHFELLFIINFAFYSWEYNGTLYYAFKNALFYSVHTHC